MNLRLDEDLASFLQELRQVAPGRKIYLVGGAVRDIVLGRKVKDLDFVVQAGSVDLAMAVKRKFKGVWYTLDDEHQTARVILRQGMEDELILDFTSFIGESLADDLSQRDFTVNAMAIDLDNLQEVIDPLGGQSDLADRRLRLSGQKSMLNDPLRVLRAVRMVRNFDLAPNPETVSELRVAAMGLNRISGERIRDELLKCLDLPGISETYFLLIEYGVLSQLVERVSRFSTDSTSTSDIDKEVNHLSDWQNETQATDQRHSYLRELEDILLRIYDEQPLRNINAGNRTFLADFADPLHHLFEQSLQGGRTRKQLLIVFALFFMHHQISETGSENQRDLACQNFSLGLTDALMFGQKEAKFFDLVCQGYKHINALSAEKSLTPLQIHRFYQKVGSYGLASAILQIAFQLAATEPEQKVIDVVKDLVLGWFQHHETLVNPPRLINGDDLQKILLLQPGPEIGVYLEAVREAQVTGQVRNRNDAFDFVRELIKGRRKHERSSQ